MTFTIGGDFALSASRGEPRNWMTRERDNYVSLKTQIYNYLKQKLGIKVKKNYRNYPFTEINLPEYSSDYSEIKDVSKALGINFMKRNNYLECVFE